MLSKNVIVTNLDPPIGSLGEIRQTLMGGVCCFQRYTSNGLMRRKSAMVSLLCFAALTLFFYVGTRDRTGSGATRSEVAPVRQAAFPLPGVDVSHRVAEELSAPSVVDGRHASAIAYEVAIGCSEQEPYAEGRIVDDGGRPIHGARVSSEDDPAIISYTDANGCFALPALSGWGKRNICIAADGMVSGVETVILGRRAQLKLQQGVLVRVQIVTRSTSGVRTALPNHLFTIRALTKAIGDAFVYSTDDGGWCTWWAASEARVQIVVPLKGRTPWTEVMAISGPCTHEVLVLAPDATIDIAVVHAQSGSRIVGARVACDNHLVGTTDRSGTCKLSVAAGRFYELRIDHLGMCGQLIGVEVPLDGPQAVVECRLVPEGVLVGLVVNAHNEPIAGADVRFVARRGLGAVTVYDGSDVHPGELSATDGQGKFRIGQFGSSYGDTIGHIEIRAPNCAYYQSDEITVPNGAVVGPIRCALTWGATIVGVVTSGGDGVSATISTSSRAGSLSTDSLGRFVLSELMPGHVTVCASLDRYPAVSESVTVKALPDRQTNLLIELDYTLEIVSGRVATSSGAGIANVRIDVGSRTLHGGTPAVYTTRTAADGRYRLEVPVQLSVKGASAFDVKVVRWNESCAKDDVLPPAVVDFVCSATAFVQLTAVDSRTGSRVALESLGLSWKIPNGTVLPCLDRCEVESGIFLAVPAEIGRLVLQYGEFERSIELTLEAGELRNLGALNVNTASRDR